MNLKLIAVNCNNDWKDNLAAIFEANLNFEVLYVCQPKAPSSIYLTQLRQNS